MVELYKVITNLFFISQQLVLLAFTEGGPQFSNQIQGWGQSYM